MTHRSYLLSIFVFAALASGCASNKYQNLRKDAGLLGVRPVYEKAPIVRQTNFSNADGTNAGSASTVVGYRDVLTGFYHSLDDRGIDEQDFYHLAGKDDVAEAIASRRSKGMLMNRIGLGLLAVSSVAAIAIPVAAGDRTLAKYSVSQWFISAPIGLALAVFGKRRVERSDNYSASHAFSALGQDAPDWAGRLDR
jgi:hypothetical protein